MSLSKFNDYITNEATARELSGEINWRATKIGKLGSNIFTLKREIKDLKELQCEREGKGHLYNYKRRSNNYHCEKCGASKTQLYEGDKELIYNCNTHEDEILTSNYKDIKKDKHNGK